MNLRALPGWIAVAIAALGVSTALAAPRQMKWEELPKITGKKIAIALPSGAAVEGKAVNATAEYLELKVTRSSNLAAAPKGVLRVSRNDLRVFELKGKRKVFRIIFTAIGGAIGFVGGVAAAWGIDGWDTTSAGSWAALYGITGAGFAGGYLLGNLADRKSETIQIVP